MLISIIIPVLNQVKYLEEAIVSVLEQDYTPKELIIIDGGSTDGTVDVIKKYQSEINYWISEADQGQSDAIQKGIAKAKGEIVNWLNADDYLLPNAFSKLAIQFADPSIQVVCAKVKRKKEGSVFDQELSQTTLKKKAEQTLVWTSIGQPGHFYRREVWNKLQGLNRAFHFSMDKELWCRYLVSSGQGNVRMLDQAVAVFRLHSNSKTANDTNGFWAEDQLICEMIRSANSAKVNMDLVKAYEKGKNALINYERGEYSIARQQLWMAIKAKAWDGPGFLFCYFKVLFLPTFVINFLRSSPPKISN